MAYKYHLGVDFDWEKTPILQNFFEQLGGTRPLIEVVDRLQLPQGSRRPCVSLEMEQMAVADASQCFSLAVASAHSCRGIYLRNILNGKSLAVHLGSASPEEERAAFVKGIGLIRSDKTPLALYVEAGEQQTNTGQQFTITDVEKTLEIILSIHPFIEPRHIALCNQRSVEDGSVLELETGSFYQVSSELLDPYLVEKNVHEGSEVKIVYNGLAIERGR